MSLFKKKSTARIPKHDLERLQARAGLLAQDDPLWPMLGALVQANVQIETELLCRADIGDEEAHRARGRVGMLLEMEAQLNTVWADSHRAA
jgi:hypothetical protein